MKIKKEIKSYFLVSLLVICGGQIGFGQPSTGFQFLPKLGLGVSRNFLVDVGLVAFNYMPERTKAQYFDANISVMTLIGKLTMVMPKLEMNAALFPVDNDELITFNLGADIGVPTDFKQSTIMISPKAGFSAASGLIRLYYHYNLLLADFKQYPGLGRHAVTLEVNISAFQGKGLKMM